MFDIKLLSPLPSPVCPAQSVLQYMLICNLTLRRSGINGWNGKFQDFNPIRFEMHMILRLISDATHKAALSGDLIPEDLYEVLEAARELSTITEQVTATILNDQPRLQKAKLKFFVKEQLLQEQKGSDAFAKAMLDISPSFGKEVDQVLGKSIHENYQKVIEELGKKPSTPA